VQQSDMIRRFCRASVMVLFLAIPLSANAMATKGSNSPPINVWSVSGKNITLDNYRGQVLLMDFFATYCEPCRRSIPHLVDLNSKYGKKGLQILGVSLDEGREKAVRTFIADKKINYTVAMANDEIINDYAIRSMPTLYVINKKGIIVEKYYGFNDSIEKSLDALVKKLLAE
jgi:cytochrome c biogenesis protein CcmG, thiol:disulfide interchange protein DsbE